MTDTLSAKKAKVRFIRSSALFSWQALEHATRSRLSSIPKAVVPRKLSEKVKLALALQGSAAAFNLVEFLKHYRLRNDIVHANESSPEPTLQDAEDMFNFVKRMLQAMYPRDEIMLTVEAI